MSKVYETLKKKNDTSVEVYPNIERPNIPDGAINTAKLEDNAVKTAKINNGAVTSDKLDDGAVITDKIADGNVTTDKLDDGAVTTAKINDGAITDVKLANGLLNRCIYIFSHTASPNFSFYVDMYSKYNTTNIESIFQELYRQIGNNVNFPCCHVLEGSLGTLGSPYGYFNGDYDTIEFTDSNQETFDININNNLTLADYKITSLF